MPSKTSESISEDYLEIEFLRGMQINRIGNPKEKLARIGTR